MIKGLKKYGVTLEEIQSDVWRYVGGNKAGGPLNKYNRYFNTNHIANCKSYNSDSVDPAFQVYLYCSTMDVPIQPKCVCGHEIIEQCYLYKKSTNEILVWGNCCIEKFKSDRRMLCETCENRITIGKTTIAMSVDIIRNLIK
jgi:hypothetical protein